MFFCRGRISLYGGNHISIKWLKQLLGELGINDSKGMLFYNDSQPTLYIA